MWILDSIRHLPGDALDWFFLESRWTGGPGGHEFGGGPAESADDAMNSKLNTLFAILSVSIIFLSIVLLTQWEKIEALENKVALMEAVMVRVGLTGEQSQ
jgi:hypothetical protein